MMMMSEGEKTEKPTAYKVSKARQDGQVAKSVDLNAAGLLGMALLLIGMSGSYFMQIMMSFMKKSFELDDATTIFNSTMFLGAFNETMHQLGLILIPFMGAMVLAGLGINFMQVRALFTLKPLEPSLNKINPMKGMKRIFSQRSVVELIKGILKMSIVGSVSYNVIQGSMPELQQLSFSNPNILLATMGSLVFKLTGWVFMVYLVLGLADWRYQAFQNEKQLRMSKQDIKDESKNLEGDQKMRANIKQAGMKILQSKQLKHLPTADVVITNPTHYAVALRYDPDIAPAPHVVAIGVDAFAQKIKAKAQALGIELVENRPLARALYDQVGYGDMIPPELFLAVAEVLAAVYAKKGKR
jgi:flagellar biosynthetic protein FlhB